MTLIFNNTNLSSLVTKYGFYETPRVITGPNEAVTRDGSGVDDTRAVKFDPSFELFPLTRAQMATIWGLAALHGYYTLRYEDATGTTKNVQARLRIDNGAKLALISSDRTLFTGVVLRFEVK